MIAECDIAKYSYVHKDKLMGFMNDSGGWFIIGEKEGDYYKVELLIPEQLKPVNWKAKEELL